MPFARFPDGRQAGPSVDLHALVEEGLGDPLGDVVVLMPAPAMPGERVDELCDAVVAAIDEST